MSSGPYIWNVGDDIIAELLVLDPINGEALTGQATYITLTIKRDSDTKYWSGTAWISTRTELSMFEVDATNEPGRYTFNLPGSTGNNKGDRYVMFFNIDNPPAIEGVNFDVHVSREQDVRVYESEPA